MCVFTLTCTCMWRPEVNLGCSSSDSIYLFSETRSLTQACSSGSRLEWLGCGLGIPPRCCLLETLPLHLDVVLLLLVRVLGMELRPLHLHTKHFTHLNHLLSPGKLFLSRLECRADGQGGVLGPAFCSTVKKPQCKTGK